MNAFDMQWRHVIGIPRDLFLKTAVKVQPFRFFSSITFSDGLPLIHSLPFRKSKKYDTSYIYISYDGRPFLALLFLGSDFFFCYQIQNTKPRYIRVFPVYVAFLEEDENVKFFY